MDHDGTMGMMNDDSMSPSSPMPNMPGMDPDQPMMTHMTFYWGKNAWILFEGWPGSDTGMYILALVLVFLIALFVEWLANCNMSSSKASHAARTVVHAMRVVLSYLVMLAVMSFNIGVFIMAVLGHTAGFFLFRVLKKSVEDDGVHPMAC